MTFWIVTAAAAGLALDAAVRGDWDVTGLSLAPLGLAVWVGWMLLLRPAVILGADELTIVNPARTATVPLARIAEVRHVLQLRVELDDGRLISAWASPGRRKPGAQASSGGRDAADGFLQAIETARADAAGRGLPENSTAPAPALRWAVRPLCAGAALLVAVVVEALLTR